MNKNNFKKGMSILGMIICGFIVILILSYFNISLRGVVESPAGQDNINYVKDTSVGFWDRYLTGPAHYLWNDIFINLFWNSFVSNLERIRDGAPTDFDLYAPKIQIDNSTNSINVGN